jgi:ABC-type glycerol-3-phosphate transport system substrate-binding protein
MNKRTKQVLALVLALVMALSLAACGKSSDTTTSNTKVTTENPEYTYVAEFTPLVSDEDSTYSPRLFTSDGYYAISYEVISSDIPEGVTPEYEGQYDVYGSFIYFVGFDGTITKLENYQELDASGYTEGKDNANYGSSIDGLCINDDGKLVTIEDVYVSWSNAPEGVSQYSDEYWNYYEYNEYYFIRVLEKDGTEISCAQIQKDDDNYLSVYNMVLDSQGNAVVTSGGDTIVGIKTDGTIAYQIQNDDYIDSIMQLSDDRLAVSVYGGSGEQLAILDIENQKLGDERYDMVNYIYNSVPGTNGYDLYYSSGTNFYGVKLEENVNDKLFSWLSCDVDSNDVYRVTVTEDGSVIAITSDWDRKTQTNTMEMVTVKQVPYDSVTHKQVITLGCQYLDYYVQQMIVQFNRSNDKYRIEVVDYSEYNTDDDYSAGVTKLNTEIMAGNAPDIIATSGLNYTQLASKGLIEDLYPYIDADSELSRDDFFQNVLEAQEVDGKLCSTVSGFYIQTVLGASSLVGDTPGWTYDDFKSALATMPEDCDPFDYYTTRDGILQTCLALDMDSYVNWTTGQCNFDSQEFKDLLEFAAQFPETFDWENYDYSNNESTQSRIAQGKQMLLATSIYSLDDLFYSNYETYFGGGYTYIGYPTANGTGNMISLDSGGLAISSKSQYKDAAWEFLRQFMMEDYQTYYQWCLPSRVDVYEAEVKDAMTIEYYKDADGNYILDENGEKEPIAKYSVYNSETDSYDDVYCASQSQVDSLTALIKSTNKCANYDSDIFDIVSEQSAAYFAGQKSADEVAKLVQSKANIFVNEQR